MWSASPRYFASLARSHVQLVKMDVLHDGRIERTITGDAVPDPVTGTWVQNISGGPRVERAKIRRTGTVDLLDVSGSLLPDEVSDLFAYLITEVRLWVGLRYWDATPAETAAGADTEYVPVGTLVVLGAESDYPHLTLTVADRMWLLSRFAEPWPVADDTNIETAMQDLLTRQIPAARLAVNLPSTEYSAGPLIYDTQDDSRDALHALALAAGWQAYCDPMGAFTASTEPSTEDPPVMTYAPGTASMLMRPKRGSSAADAENAVVFTGESPGRSPLRGYAEDTNPASVTYVGRVGVRPRFESSPLIRNASQAELAARTALNRILGQADAVVAPVVPNPALEVGDVIRVVDPDQNLDLPVIVDSFPVPLRASDGAQQLTCRARVLR